VIVIMTGKKPRESYLWFFISFSWHFIHLGCTQSLPFVTINPFKCARYVWSGVGNWWKKRVVDWIGCRHPGANSKLLESNPGSSGTPWEFVSCSKVNKGFYYLIFIWCYELAQVLRTETGVAKFIANSFPIATSFTDLIINAKRWCGILWNVLWRTMKSLFKFWPNFILI